jgi:hypothetical protein
MVGRGLTVGKSADARRDARRAVVRRLQRRDACESSS